MKVGIAIDAWKLPIFERHLTMNGFKFEKCPGILDDTLILKVDTEMKADLENVAKQANIEAARKGNK